MSEFFYIINNTFKCLWNLNNILTIVMKINLIINIAVVLLSVCYVHTEDTDSEPDLDPSSTETGYDACTAKDGSVGKCVPVSYCNEDHTIMPGGVIDKSEYRSLSPPSRCQGQLDWCCSEELIINPPDIGTEDTEKCLELDSDVCPWCAKLYKVTNVTHRNPGVYCAGALIGSQVVLTAATCLTAAKFHMIYARFPLSADPDKKYIAEHRQPHPEYNTGTHQFDYGLIVLKEKVEWNSGVARGACLRSDKLGGMCITLGFDDNDNFASTIIQVSEGKCSNMGGGSSSEIFCGTKKDTQCFAAPGAPVICQTSKGSILGVVRSGCLGDNILIGGITKSYPWVEKELKKMKVPKELFTP